MTASSPVRQAPGGAKLVWSIMALAMALMLLTIYTFLHESGHALLGLLFGGRLTSFSIRFWDLSAYVGIDGHLSALQGSMVAAAGAGLPLVVLAVLLARVPRVPSAGLDFVRIVASLTILNSLLPWLVIPVLYLTGQAPGDDVTNFLRLSQLPPLAVAAGALTVYAGGWAFFLSRAGGIREIWYRWRRSLPGLLRADSMRDVKILAGVCIAVVAVAVAASIYLVPGNALGSPLGYREVARFSLAEIDLVDSPVYRFALEHPGQVSLYFSMQDITAGPVKIALSGPSLYKTFFAAGTDAAIGRATVDPGELVFKPGEYQVELTFPRQAGGKVAVYVKLDN
jgi:hypothetical protein